MDNNIFEAVQFYAITSAFGVSFLFHVVTFCSVFYVVLHEDRIPQWLINSLWGVGLSSGMFVMSMLIEMSFGPYVPLSFSSMHTILDIISTGFLAIFTGGLVVNYVNSHRHKKPLSNRASAYKRANSKK